MKGLHPEDYLEPSCVFCKPEEGAPTPVDLRRCITRLDEYLDRNDYAAAERHLDFWQQEAAAGRDWRGLLSIENERMGLFRKIGKEGRAMESVRAAEELVSRAGLEDTVTAATTWLNIGTVYKNFGKASKALPYYEKARAIYESALPPEDCRLGGLYNNLALALADLGDYVQARALYERALKIMGHQESGALEQAITELNLANLAEAEQGLLEAETEIEARLDRALALLNRPELPQNGYYAFVCEKCAPTFHYYGRFADAQALADAARQIHSAL
ncbi:MAG: tetratricopeptide repeat protein [Oscillospiraceae bacterium]|nr:tetratricopeptide repeat protein [Oscillospiraceae bacterium]